MAAFRFTSIRVFNQELIKYLLNLDTNGGKKKYKETLLKAIAELRTGSPLQTVSKKFRVPQTTLFRKLKQDMDYEKGSGVPPILDAKSEHLIADWTIAVRNVEFGTIILKVCFWIRYNC